MRPEPEILIKIDEVIRQTSLKKSTIYDQIREGIFPKQKPLGRRRVGWRQSEIEAYKDGTFVLKKAGA